MNWEAANKTITTLGWIVIPIWIGIGIYKAPVIGHLEKRAFSQL
jgi:hypothetical protein